MSKRFPLVAAVVVASILSIGSQSASAVIITVPSSATGFFGAVVSSPANYVTGYPITLPGGALSETVQITATGLIDIGLGSPNVTPNGFPIAATPSPSNYYPLEEKIIDAGGSLPSRTVPNVGAVIAAFVPASIASNISFVPRDEDVTALGIDADALFFVGAGPAIFNFTQPGTLYFGVNDDFAANNSGSFSVTIVTTALEFPAPEPSTCAMLASGIVGLTVSRRLRRRQG